MDKGVVSSRWAYSRFSHFTRSHFFCFGKGSNHSYPDLNCWEWIKHKKRVLFYASIQIHKSNNIQESEKLHNSPPLYALFWLAIKSRTENCNFSLFSCCYCKFMYRRGEDHVEERGEEAPQFTFIESQTLLKNIFYCISHHVRKNIRIFWRRQFVLIFLLLQFYYSRNWDQRIELFV